MRPGPIPIALAITLGAFAPALAQTSAPEPHVTVSTDAPQWDRLPTSSELVSLYPQAALDRQAGAHTTITCHVQADGTLTSCAIVEENPRRYGFGRATIAAAPFFRLRSRSPEGTPAQEQNVRISMEWSDR